MFFPRLAMDSRKALSCLRMKFSSGNRQRGIKVSEGVPHLMLIEILLEIKKIYIINQKT